MSTSPRQNRTITVDFKDEATYHRLCQDGKSFIEFVVAFIISLGFQLTHRCDCPGGFALTRHSHYSRVRLNNLTLWRLQCCHCRTVFTNYAPFCLTLQFTFARSGKTCLASHARWPEFRIVRHPV